MTRNRDNRIRDEPSLANLLFGISPSPVIRFLLSIYYTLSPMSRLRIITFITLLTALLLSRSPYLMTSTAPTKPWADGPMKLVVTPQFQTKKVSVSIRVCVICHSN